MKKIGFLCLIAVASLSASSSAFAQAQGAEQNVLGVLVPAHCLKSVAVQDNRSAGDLCYATANGLHTALMKNISMGNLQHKEAQDIFQTEQMIRMLAEHYWLGGQQ